MSELINNSRVRIDHIKSTIKNLHDGVSVEESENELKKLMKEVPHGEIVTAEQELIEEGMPEEEIVKHCDLHSAAMKNMISDDYDFSDLHPAHPINTFINENKFINRRIEEYNSLVHNQNIDDEDEFKSIDKLKELFRDLTDLDKHYQRKENLVFSYMEKYEITGPPKVMWAKHDEVRSFLKNVNETLRELESPKVSEIRALAEFTLDKTIELIGEMIIKEEKILLPMCYDTFTEGDWFEIYYQSDEIGFCLFQPSEKWEPANLDTKNFKKQFDGKVKLSTGVFKLEELEAIFRILPVDLTFVDKNDRVKFFSAGENRVFARNKAIIGRSVQNCHPPASVHIVEKILSDFKSGEQNTAKFWINFRGTYVHIAYYAIRGEEDEYLGTLEVTQEINEFRELEGERRILNYDN